MPAGDSPILLFNLSRDPSSSYDPMINAVEFCIIHDVLPGTDAEDVTALTALKTSLGYTQWVGDPCDPVPWDELGCTQDRVTSLNLSNKNLTGSIPSDISNLTALTILNLSENQLVGPIPIWVGDLFLQTLDVSNNNLSGSFPATYFLTISNFRYSGNPLLICVDVPTSSAACPQSPAPAPVPSPPPPSMTSGKTSTGPIIGGVAGAIVVLLVAGGLLIWYMCAAPEKSVSIRTPPSPSMGVGLIRTTAAHHVPRNKTRPFTLQAIKVATTNFSTKIGEGGFGPVYHGIVDGQQEVAVKVMSQTTRQGFDEFLNEIDLLSSIHHKSLVNLLGYCEEELELILLYEYMSGGDLRNRLQGPTALQHPLNWSQRLQIALDAAKGLQYLHHGCNPSIIHRDVKSSNILLNQNLEAKVADFGLSKLTDGQSNLVTAVKGTLGYLDPEYNRTGLLNDKTDVYSFGIVLMEILCGHPPIVRQGQFIVDEVKSAMNSGAVLSVVDPVLREADIPVESVWRYVDIAMACVSPSSTSRPSMQTVVSELRSLALESQRQTAGGTDFSGDYPDPTPDQPSLIFYASEDPSAQ